MRQTAQELEHFELDLIRACDEPQHADWEALWRAAERLGEAGVKLWHMYRTR